MDSRAKQIVRIDEYKGLEIRVIETQGYSARLVAILENGLVLHSFDSFAGEAQGKAKKYIDNIH